MFSIFYYDTQGDSEYVSFVMYKDCSKLLYRDKWSASFSLIKQVIDMDEVINRVSPLNDEKEKLIIYIDQHEEAPVAISVDEAWEVAQSFTSAVNSESLEEIHCIMHKLIDKIVVLNDDVSIYWSFCQN